MCPPCSFPFSDFPNPRFFSDLKRKKDIASLMKVVEFKVGMTCGGCSGAVTRILKKIEGVQEIDANLETLAVKVTCEDGVDSQVMLDALLKWSEASKKSVELVG